MNFRRLATIADLSPYRAIDPNHYRVLTFRQDDPRSPHRDTQTVYLRMPATISYHSIFEEIAAVDYPAYQPLRHHLETLCAIIGQLPARIMLVKLKPGGVITPHTDEGSYASATDRYHLAIDTNPDVLMTSGDDTRHLPEGELWAFNKHVPHSVVNAGATDRVHLIIDGYRA